MPQNIENKLSRRTHEHRNFVDPITEAFDILSETGYEIKRDILARLRPVRK